jgi:RNA polymerase sigma-70 factor, ECF subfamily
MCFIHELEKCVPGASANALEDWIRESASRAVAYARTLIRDRHRAEDLVQDCYGRLLAKADRYDLIRDGTKLLMTAITNACINETQRAKPMLRFVNDDDEKGWQEPPDRKTLPVDAPLMEDELKCAIASALAALPPQQRAAVELKSLGHSQAEIAEILGVNESNVGVLIHRGRQSLAGPLSRYLTGGKEMAS